MKCALMRNDWGVITSYILEFQEVCSWCNIACFLYIIIYLRYINITRKDRSEYANRIVWTALWGRLLRFNIKNGSKNSKFVSIVFDVTCRSFMYHKRLIYLFSTFTTNSVEPCWNESMLKVFARVWTYICIIITRAGADPTGGRGGCAHPFLKLACNY